MTKRHSFRLIDSGVDEGRRQIAYDAALTELHGAGKAPDTVRFMRFPPTVLVGRHQILADEVHVERCRAEGVGLVRRVSGGGAIYLDEGQVGWELVMHRATLGLGTLGAHAQAICEAVALGLSERFGIAARFRPRNDIEVDGRKIGGTGGFFVGDTLVYQGTVLVDMDADRMARLLNIPASKLQRHDTGNAASRVVTLQELLGRTPSIDDVHAALLHGLAQRLGIEGQPARPGSDEIALTARLLAEEIGTDDFVHGKDMPPGEVAGEPLLEGVNETPGGTIRVWVRLEGRGGGRRIREILVSGDFFVVPPRFVYDLESCLRGVAVAELPAVLDRVFDATPPELLSMTSADLKSAIASALDGNAMLCSA